MKYLLPLLVVLVLSSGCQTIPKDAFRLSISSLAERQLQTREFETNNEISLLIAGVGVLQDMGYTIEATEKNAGLITASKMVDATDGVQVTMAILGALAGVNTPIDKEQKIRVTLVTHPSRESGYYIARITFQRIVWNTHGQITKAESIKSTELYSGFFDKLSKSVFLEAHQI